MAIADTLPIIMTAIDYDPVALGYVKSLARPGGNVTGLFAQQIDLTAKRIQLLKDHAGGNRILGCTVGLSMEGN
jgi:putative ABC transport system substrate-binding protein